MSGIAAILTELSTSPKRKVYIVKWGRSDKTCWSFHHTLLVADNGVNKDISAYTTGVIFDWGSYVAGGIVKSDIPVKVKPFNSHEFHVGKAKKNIYKFVGWTDWDDKSTEELMRAVGHHYHLINNNCRTVVKKTSKCITKFPTIKISGIVLEYPGPD